MTAIFGGQWEEPAMSTADPNFVIVTGENPFIRLARVDSDNFTHQRQLSGASSSPPPDRGTSSISRAS